MTTLRVAALACWMAAGACIPAAELTSDQWRADLAFLAKELPLRHKNAFHTIPRAEFERRVAEIDAAIPKLSDSEIRAAIARLVAAVGDGHTAAQVPNDRVFDLTFRHFPDGLFVTGGAKVYQDTMGARVVSIDGTSADEVRRRLSEFVAAENEYSAVAYGAFVRVAALLRATAITRSPETAEFALEKAGRTFTLTAKSRAAKDPQPEQAETAFPLPLYLRRGKEAYWFEYLTDAKTLYINYNSCREMQALPFQKFTAQILEVAAREKPEKLIVDLRRNGGGNSEVSNPLLKAMHDNKVLRPRGGVYVFAGPYTFSSGLLVLLRLRDRFHAIVAGEPTTERPNHYGEVRVLQLPNSGIQVRYSTKHFTEEDGDPPSVEPELRVPLTAADYFAGRDPVLQAVLKLPASVEANYKDVIGKDPHNVRAPTELAAIYREQGRDRDAEALLRVGLTANRQSVDLRLALADLMLKQKKYRAARAALGADLDSSAILFEIGVVNEAEGKTSQAVEAFRKCYRLEPDNLRGLKGAAGAYARQKDPDAALGLLNEEAERNPGNVEIRWYAAYVAARAGWPDSEFAEYRKAIEQSSPGSQNRFETWLQMSEAYRHNGNSAEAIRTFRASCDEIQEIVQSTKEPAKLMGINPLAAKASALSLLADRYEALLHWQPDDAVLMTSMALILSASAKDPDRALRLARRAGELLPDVDQAGDNLGLVYLNLQKTEQAVAVFRGLVSKTPENAEFRSHLAMALGKDNGN